jgi:hypothetical protein
MYASHKLRAGCLGISLRHLNAICVAIWLIWATCVRAEAPNGQTPRGRIWFDAVYSEVLPVRVIVDFKTAEPVVETRIVASRLSQRDRALLKGLPIASRSSLRMDKAATLFRAVNSLLHEQARRHATRFSSSGPVRISMKLDSSLRSKSIDGTVDDHGCLALLDETTDWHHLRRLEEQFLPRATQRLPPSK